MTNINRDEPIIITLHWEEDFNSGGYSWRSPDFKRAFVDELKELVPAEDRSYDSVNQIWTVDCGYAPDVQALIEEYFKADVVYDETGCDYE